MDRKVVCELSGGLGNQMFCYAAARAVAEQMKLPLFIDISSYANDTFGRSFALSNYKIEAENIGFSRKNVLSKIGRKLRIWNYDIISSPDQYQNVNGKSRKSIYLDGFWHRQNFKIFDKYKEKILNEFTYSGNISQPCLKLLEENDDYYTIAVHLRYGDYVKIGCCIETSYYEKAIRMMEKCLPNKHKKIRMLVFSEDIETSKKIIGKIDTEFEKIYINRQYGFSDWEEFYLISHCNAQVVSNSTFSWWAAYLCQSDGQRVVVPVVKKWQDYGCWEENYFPEDWVQIEATIQ